MNKKHEEVVEKLLTDLMEYTAQHTMRLRSEILKLLGELKTNESWLDMAVHKDPIKLKVFTQGFDLTFNMLSHLEDLNNTGMVVGNTAKQLPFMDQKNVAEFIHDTMLFNDLVEKAHKAIGKVMPLRNKME